MGVIDKMTPWYSRIRPENPTSPVDSLVRPYVVDLLGQGKGCPDFARCGVDRRDGDGCAYILDDPNAPMIPHHRRCINEGTGAVGIYLRTQGANQNVQLFTPESLRRYAVAWRKVWSAPFNCSVYEGLGGDMGCQGVGPLEGYASEWARLWASGDHTTADVGILGKPSSAKQALSDYTKAIDLCLQAGDDWQSCADIGNLQSLERKASEQGVPLHMLRNLFDSLGKNNAETRSLREGVTAACQIHTNRTPGFCSSIADAVVSSALSSAHWILAFSGKDLQKQLQALSKDTMGDLYGDPQTLTAAAVPTMQSAWKDSLDALRRAWVSARITVGLQPEPRDFETPLKTHLLNNGWGCTKSYPWYHNGTSVWLLEASRDPMSINPARSDHSQWPWASAYKNWSRRCNCGIRARDGLFSLYGILRIDPLQQALRQGLRDIAVIVADEVNSGTPS